MSAEHLHHHEQHHSSLTNTAPKLLDKFEAIEKIPSKELGVWEQSLKIVTDAAVGLVLMRDQMDKKTRNELENTVAYRLGFSPDPRHLLPEEVAFNSALDNAIVQHLQTKKDLVRNLAPGQLARALLLMRSVRFDEEEMYLITEKLQDLDQEHLKKDAVIEELRPTLNYSLKLAGAEATFFYSQILQVIALGMSIRAKNKGPEYSSMELKIIRLSSMFNDVGFTLSNFRSNSNPYAEQYPYLLKPGQTLQQFEQAVSGNNPDALKAFLGLDAHSRGEDMMGLHGAIRMENGKVVQELCADHTEQVKKRLQQAEQTTKQLTQPSPAKQPLMPPLYRQPYPYGAPRLNQFSGLLRLQNSPTISSEISIGGFSPVTHVSERTGKQKIKNNKRRKISTRPNKLRDLDFGSPRAVKVNKPVKGLRTELPHAKNPDSAPLVFAKTVMSAEKQTEKITNTKNTGNPVRVVISEYTSGSPVRKFIGQEPPRPIISTKLYRSDVISAVYPKQPGSPDIQPASAGSPRPAEPSVPRFAVSPQDTKPKSPKPTPGNPNNSLNNGESVGKPVSKPVEVPSITIGTNLSKAFEKIHKQEQQEHTAAAIEKSLSITASASILEVHAVPASQTRQAGGSASNTKETRIANAETISATAPKGTDEHYEEARVVQNQVPSPTAKTQPAFVPIKNVKKARQTDRQARAALALYVNNEYLDFTNPHSIGDAFRQALINALAA
jgi:hypothetical protein